MTDSLASSLLHSLSLSIPSSPSTAASFSLSYPSSPSFASIPSSPSLASFPSSPLFSPTFPSSPPSLSPSAPPAPVSLDLSSPSPSLRLGTFNCGSGFVRKLPRILSTASTLQLDVIALQEIGDPALIDSRFPPYTLIQAPGKTHQAGVGLLLAQSLLPRVRSYHRSSTGRLVGAVLELHTGHSMLLVSAYMPTGLDHCSASSDEHELAHKLYRELSRWSKDMQQVVVMGDLNETLTVHDRLPQPRAAPASNGTTPIGCLTDEGYTDVWRTLHPSALLRAGFTHRISGERPSKSRIDYLWCKGTKRADLLQVHIDKSLRQLSHHSLLWMELQLPDAATAAADEPLAPPPRLPDLRDLSQEHEKAFGEKLQHALDEQQQSLHEAFAHADSDSLSWAASLLTATVRKVAWACLPMTSGPAARSQCILRLQRQRKALARLQRCSKTSHCFTLDSEWRKWYAVCTHALQLQWRIDPHTCSDTQAWLNETAQLQRSTRSSIRVEQRRMLHRRTPAFDAHPAAQVHRMMRSDELPAQLLSVVDSTGQLTNSADELKAVMAQHFRDVFTVPPAPAAPLLPSVPDMLLHKATVQPHWYDGLMSEVDAEELLSTTADTPLVTAPGEDEVSSGLWKLALRSCPPLQLLVCSLFSACLRVSLFPACWKSSIIVPLVKDAKKERRMNNIRPISLQSCLGKLLNKVLVHRLGHILARHSILHPAQRGFINGGTITKCIDELLDAWEHGRTARGQPQEQYTLFYDIKQAYDSVQVEVLERAMHRLRMPHSFVALVVDSLTGLTSRVRTAYGLSELFDVLRSLRQGDPLAPLLFVILMDGLHDGLERNPFTDEQHGLRMQVSASAAEGRVTLPSLGYADDTTVLTNTLPAMRAQNEWVHYFMAFNRMRLNAAKCELVGRDDKGQPVTAADLATHGIVIEGAPLLPVPHTQPIRYLGVHARFDGCWEEQRNKALNRIALFTRAVTKFTLSPQQAVYMFNAFLLPSLELALHYVHGQGTSTWVSQCDRMLIGSIKHAVQSPIMLSNSALALSLHLILPSWLEASIKVSELYLRVNDPDTRWGRLGRLLLRRFPTVLVSEPRKYSMSDAISHAAHSRLSWTLLQRELPNAAASIRQRHLFDQPPVAPAHIVPTAIEHHCSVSKQVQLTDVDCITHIAHDVWRGWGADIEPQTVHAYSDGSYVPEPPASSWAVTIRDHWLDEHFLHVPSDETQVTAHSVSGAHMCGASITNTRGIYPAELQAIARTLALFPLSYTLHVHSDSQSSIDAIRSYEQLSNERRRMRMSAHTLLQLIHHLLRVRQAAGGSVHWHHVRAHTTDTDIHSVGNRLSDYQANLRRLSPAVTRPDGLRPLPLRECERHLSILDQRTGMQVIDDVRRTALRQIKRAALTHWQRKRDGREYFAGQAALDTGRMVLRQGTAALQATFVHLVTNSLHFHWPLPSPAAAAAAAVGVQEQECAPCTAVAHAVAHFTPAHILTCSHVTSVDFRKQLRRSILALLSQQPLTAEWMRQFGEPTPSLQTVLLALVPYPASLTALPAADRAEQQQRHLTHSMCGILTTSQLHAAAKRIGFTAEDEVASGVRLMQQLCMRCIKHIGRVFEPP